MVGCSNTIALSGWHFESGKLPLCLGGLELRAKMGSITYLVDDGQKQVAAQVPHLPDTDANPALHHR